MDENESKEDEDEMAFLSKKLQRFLREKRKPMSQKKNPIKHEHVGSSNNSSTQPTCFECKKPGHFKLDCPVYLSKLMENEKRKRKLTFKKANLPTWGNDEVDSGDEKEKDEEALLCLMIVDD